MTLNNRGVITRTYTNLTEAALENAVSRVFGGVGVAPSCWYIILSVVSQIHFQFAGQAGIQLGTLVACETLKEFDNHWAQF